MALTDVPSGASDSTIYMVEVRAGADDEKNYFKHQVVEFRVRGTELADISELPETFHTELERGIAVAEQIDTRQLQESYPPAKIPASI